MEDFTKDMEFLWRLEKTPLSLGGINDQTAPLAICERLEAIFHVLSEINKKL